MKTHAQRLDAAEKRAIQRRLDRWELDHLRAHAAELAQRLEDAERRASEAERRAWDAEARADMFHDLAMQLEDEMPSHQAVGLTRDGALLLVETDPSPRKALPC
jgi:hypothetical protein